MAETYTNEGFLYINNIPVQKADKEETEENNDINNLPTNNQNNV